MMNCQYMVLVSFDFPSIGVHSDRLFALELLLMDLMGLMFGLAKNCHYSIVDSDWTHHSDDASVNHVLHVVTDYQEIDCYVRYACYTVDDYYSTNIGFVLDCFHHHDDYYSDHQLGVVHANYRVYKKRFFIQ